MVEKMRLCLYMSLIYHMKIKSFYKLVNFIVLTLALKTTGPMEDQPKMSKPKKKKFENPKNLIIPWNFNEHLTNTIIFFNSSNICYLCSKVAKFISWEKKNYFLWSSLFLDFKLPVFQLNKQKSRTFSKKIVPSFRQFKIFQTKRVIAFLKKMYI